MLSQAELVEELFNLCKIKEREFSEEDYTISAEEIWEYVTLVKSNEVTKLYQFVASIFSLEFEEIALWRERKTNV